MQEQFTMNENPRRLALDRIDRIERNARYTMLGVVAVEFLFLLTFIALADFHNRTHVLILIAAVGTYSILGLGLIALGTRVSRDTQRILKAIDLIRQ
jgi:hypothetical protein